MIGPDLVEPTPILHQIKTSFLLEQNLINHNKLTWEEDTVNASNLEIINEIKLPRLKPNNDIDFQLLRLFMP